MASAWYATRESVKAALDVAETARRNQQVDDAIEAASRNVEGLLHRIFYPLDTTEYFDWPNRNSNRAFKLYMLDREFITVTAITVDNGAVTLTPAQYFLRPEQGPPYSLIEINLGTSASLSSSTTGQQAIAVSGTRMGCPAVTGPAGALAEALDASETGVDVTDSSQIGVGTILVCESERMIVTGRSLLTSGQALLTPIDADESDQILAVTTGTAFFVGEVLTLDSERMRIDDIAGNNLIVTRAVDGSTLAAHTGSTIYAPRTLTVERGSLGTTAASHLTATALTRHVPPGLVATLTRAYSLNTLLQEGSGYARVVGTGDNAKQFSGRDIAGLELDAAMRHGRKLRYSAVR
jgi:hypothetical protein